MEDQLVRATFKCSACKKRFFAEGFKLTRLEQRNKTCLECAVRKRQWLDAQQADPEKYEHWKTVKRAANARYFAKKREQEQQAANP
jgi:hypothetical protein